jgi:hypothetical protein
MVFRPIVSKRFPSRSAVISKPGLLPIIDRREGVSKEKKAFRRRAVGTVWVFHYFP